MASARLQLQSASRWLTSSSGREKNGEWSVSIEITLRRGSIVFIILAGQRDERMIR